MTPAELAALHARAIAVPRPWSEGELAALLGTPQVHLSAEAGGFALGRTIAGEAELLTLVIDPALRRQGRGRRLLAQFEAEATRRGAATGFLEVAVDNVAALALYAGAGWQRAGLRTGYYITPGGRRVDAAVLSKTFGAT